MNTEETGIIVIPTNKLRELIAETLKEELTQFERRIKEALPEKKPTADRLYTKDVAKLLDISRQTVNKHQKNGILPPPQFSTNNRPYWTKEQIKEALSTNGHGYKYDL